MMVASGPTLDQLVKRRVVLEAPPGEGNIKEATLWQTSTGDWRLFYEYAANEASRIGVASGPSPSGRWTVLPTCSACAPKDREATDIAFARRQ